MFEPEDELEDEEELEDGEGVGDGVGVPLEEEFDELHTPSVQLVQLSISVATEPLSQ